MYRRYWCKLPFAVNVPRKGCRRRIFNRRLPARGASAGTITGDPCGAMSSQARDVSDVFGNVCAYFLNARREVILGVGAVCGPLVLDIVFVNLVDVQ